MGFIQEAKDIIVRHGDNHITRRCMLEILSLDSTGIQVTEDDKHEFKNVILGIGDQLMDGTSVNALLDKAVERIPDAEEAIENARKVFRDSASTTQETNGTGLVMSIAFLMLDELTPFDHV